MIAPPRKAMFSAGFTPRVTHRIDSLDLVEDLVVAGRGVALLPSRRATRDGVVILDLDAPGLERRAYAVTRQGREHWAPLRALLERLVDAPDPAERSRPLE